MINHIASYSYSKWWFSAAMLDYQTSDYQRVPAEKSTDRSEPGFYTYILESASSPGILYDNFNIPLLHFPIEWGRVGLMFFYWVLSSQNVGFSIYAQIWYTTRWKRGSGEGITKNQLFHLHLETPGHIIRCLDNMFELVFPSCRHYADGIWVHPFPILGQRRFTAWFWWDLPMHFSFSWEPSPVTYSLMKSPCCCLKFAFHGYIYGYYGSNVVKRIQC